MIFKQEPTSLLNQRLLRPGEDINSLRSAGDAHAAEELKACNWQRNARGSAQSEIEVLGINARPQHVRAREWGPLIKFD